MQVDPRGKRWAAVDPVALWAPVRAWFPEPPARVLEVGAGSGRDAAWFATLGYDVTCVEPDLGLWPEGAAWVQSALPDLIGVEGAYDLITISAVWHLVPQDAWGAAFERLGALAVPQGRLILSLRRPPITDAMQVRTAAWKRVHQVRRPSVQPGNRAAGVEWDWCVLSRVAPG